MKKLGSVPFLNSQPLTYLFDNNLIDNYITYNYFPSSLLQPLIDKDVFLSLLSIADHLSNQEVVSLDNYCISSYGKVDSVILISKSNLKDIKLVVQDSRSKSSNMLFKVIQEVFLKTKMEYSIGLPSLGMEMKNDIGYIIIGDLSLEILSSNPSGLNIYDLGEIWYKETGLPFTFGTYNYISDPPSELELNYLDNSFKEGIKSTNAIIETFLIKTGYKIDRKLAHQYLNEKIYYKIEEEHIKGINLFIDLSAKFANWKKSSFNKKI
tara:strand:- start:21 stop:818 length:798 start_codon:yes stop_codon:yes gene_type:complete